MKRLEFLGSSRQDVQSFPDGVRLRAGHDLYLVQEGGEPSDFEPMTTIGPGSYEIRVRDSKRAFRVIYVAKFESAVYVLHAFEKKTPKTSQADIELARERYRMIKELK